MTSRPVVITLAIIGIVAIAGLATTVLYGALGLNDSPTERVEESGLATYGEDDRPISAAEYRSVSIGDNVETLTERFGEPNTIVHGAEIARGEDDIYSWKVRSGGLIDRYTFDVDPSTKRVTAKALF